MRVMRVMRMPVEKPDAFSRWPHLIGAFSRFDIDDPVVDRHAGLAHLALTRGPGQVTLKVLANSANAPRGSAAGCACDQDRGSSP